MQRTKFLTPKPITPETKPGLDSTPPLALIQRVDRRLAGKSHVVWNT